MNEQGIFSVEEIGQPQLKIFFQEQGYVLIRNLVSAGGINAILSDINQLIKIKAWEAGIKEIAEDKNTEAINNRLYRLVCEADREWGGQIYRACRNLLSIHELSVDSKIVGLSKRLMESEYVNHLGYTAVRIDNPDETKFLFPWHQDFPYTQGSMDGLVFWIPLHDVPIGHGHLRIIPASQKHGVKRVHLVDPENSNRNGAHTIRIENMEQYENESYKEFEIKKGDAIVFSTLLLHRSTPTTADYTRWTMQLRYANFANKDAISKGWPGGMLAGGRFQDIYPEYIAPE